MVGLASGDVERALAARRVETRGEDRVPHGGERVAELVTEHRQELVFGAARCLGLGARDALGLERAVQRHLGEPPFRRLGLQRGGLLLQPRDGPQPLLGSVEHGVAFRGNDTHVLSADARERCPVPLVVEASHRIRTEQGKRHRRSERVPQLFETNGGFGMALRPQQRDHLAERTHAPALAAACRRGGHDASDDVAEPRRIQCPVDHQRGKRRGRVQRNVASIIPRRRDVHPARA